MKKVILAAILSTTGVMAIAQSNVTVYGTADVGVERNFSDSTTRMNGDESFVGLKGREDLGNGSAVIFGLEAGFNVDDGTQAASGTLFNRQSFVGLTGPGGTLKLGRLNTPIYEALNAIDPFQTRLTGDASNLMYDGGRRTSNTINYANSLGPVNGQVAFGFGEGSRSKDGRVVGVAVDGTFGPVYTTAAYHQVSQFNDKSSSYLLGAVGDVTKGVKVHGAFGNTKGVAGNDSKEYLVGTTLQATEVDTILASVVQKDRKQFGDSTQYGVGWNHTLSPRTALYTSYGYTKHDAQKDDQLVNVGIRHVF